MKCKILFFMLALLCASCLSQNESIFWQLNQASSHFEAGEYNKAIPIYQQILKKRPDYSIAHFNIAGCYYKLKKYKEALDHYLKSGDDYLALKNLGNTYKRLGDLKNGEEKENYYKKALAFYKKAIILNEKDLKVKYNYEYLEKILKQLESEKQNKDNKKTQDKNQNDKKDQSEKNSDQKNKENQNKNQKEDQNNKPQSDKDNQQNQQENQSKKDKNDDQNQSSKGKTDQNQTQEESKKQNKEQTEKILQALEAKEKEDLKNNLRIKQLAPTKNSSKNW